MKPVFLLDIDGVVADFATPVVRAINERLGTVYTTEDVHDWDIYGSLEVPPSVCTAIDERICTKGFCASLEPYPEAIDGVEQLREIAHVVAVTAPFDSDYWMREREQWLIHRFGFRREDIIFTSAKHIVVGDALIDDKASTVEKWRVERTGTGVLFSRPWNRSHNNPDLVRVTGWPHLVAFLKVRFGARGVAA